MAANTLRRHARFGTAISAAQRLPGSTQYVVQDILQPVIGQRALLLGTFGGNTAAFRRDHRLLLRIEAEHIGHVHGLAITHHAVASIHDAWILVGLFTLQQLDDRLLFFCVWLSFLGALFVFVLDLRIVL